MAVTGQAQWMRADIRASWDRLRRLGLHRDHHRPEVILSPAELRARRHDQQLAAVWPVLFTCLEAAAAESGHVVFVADSTGHLLWMLSDSGARPATERANLVPGVRWRESDAGTNGVGTALTLGRPFQVRGPEHYLSVAADFTCTAAPIRDPRTGAVIGVVDVTSPMRRTSPLALSLVTAAARLAEARLRDLALQHDARVRTRYLDRVLSRSGMSSGLADPSGRILYAVPEGWLPPVLPVPVAEGETTLPDGRRVSVERLAPGGAFEVRLLTDAADADTAQFWALGRNRAILRLDGTVHELSVRHSELMVLLLDNPDGLTGAELAQALYGAAGKAVTVRAELTRLRRVVGYRLASDPYRLDSRIGCDFRDPEFDTGDRPGSLLPASRAPGIRRIRQRLERRRSAPDSARSG